MSYNISTKPSNFTINKRINELKKSMGNSFIDYDIITDTDGKIKCVDVTTTLRPSLRMFEACENIMKPFNIVFDHQTLDHYVINFLY